MAVESVGLTEQTIFLSSVAAVAGAALVVIAFSVYRAGARTKTKDTLEAWAKWADDSREARREVSRVLVKGEEDNKKLTSEQAAALLGGPGGKLKDKYDSLLDESERRKLANQIRDVLNGLERLAVGVEKGFYDLAVLRILGKSVITQTYKQFEPYIELTRKKDPAKTAAFKELSTLYRRTQGPMLINAMRAIQRH